MFLYVNKQSYERPEVKVFMDFILGNARRIVEHPKVNYVALPDELYSLGKQRLERGTTGSAMAAGKGQSLNLEELYRKH